MLALEPLITARLAQLSALAGWGLRGAAAHTDRRPLPAVDVRCLRAGVSDSRGAGAMVQPQWTLVLAVARGADATTALDAAIGAVVESLHGWLPGQAGGRAWEPLKLADITEPIFADVGIVGYELTFTTSALYRGQQ